MGTTGGASVRKIVLGLLDRVVIAGLAVAVSILLMTARPPRWPPLRQPPVDVHEPPGGLDRHRVIDPFYAETDVNSLITITSPGEADARRKELIAFVWGTGGLPTRTPTLQRNITDPRYSDWGGVASIDRLSVRMAYGIDSVVYHFHPRADAASHLILYHQGHDGDFIKGRQCIEGFLHEGYAVMAFAMPLCGLNSRPVVHFPRLGSVRIQSHDQLPLLHEPPLNNGLRFFLEPVVACLNHAAPMYRRVSIVGLSGGGWTTVVCSALDTRIDDSFSVAGSLPLFLRWPARPEHEEQGDWGDYEQTLPDFYRLANYLELYLLAGSPRGRKHVQIINEYDIFGGRRHEVYAAALGEAAERLGGCFSTFVDAGQRRHVISQKTLAFLRREIRAAAKGAP